MVFWIHPRDIHAVLGAAWGNETKIRMRTVVEASLGAPKQPTIDHWLRGTCSPRPCREFSPLSCTCAEAGSRVICLSIKQEKEEHGGGRGHSKKSSCCRGKEPSNSRQQKHEKRDNSKVTTPGGDAPNTINNRQTTTANTNTKSERVLLTHQESEHAVLLAQTLTPVPNANDKWQTGGASHPR